MFVQTCHSTISIDYTAFETILEKFDNYLRADDERDAFYETFFFVCIGFLLTSGDELTDTYLKEVCVKLFVWNIILLVTARRAYTNILHMVEVMNLKSSPLEGLIIKF